MIQQAMAEAGFLWTTTSLFWASRRLAERALAAGDGPGPTPAERWLGTFVWAPSLAVVTLIALHLVGLLVPLGPAVVFTLVGLGDLAVQRLRAEPQPAFEPWAARDPQTLVLIGVAGAIAGAWGAELGAGTAFLWDDLSYHAANPAAWLTSGSLDLPALTYQAYFSLDAELFAFLFMLPLRSDAHANLSIVVWALVLGLSFRVLAARLSHPPLLTAAGLLALFAAPIVRRNVDTFCAHDLAAAAFPLAAIALVRPGSPVGWALTSGLAAGFAVGVRPPMGVLGLCVAVAWATKGSRVHVGAFVAGALATGSFWLARNLVLTGNPLYPAEILGLDGPFTVDLHQSTAITSLLRSDFAEGLRILGIRLVDWPYPLGAVEVVGLLAGLAALRRPDQRWLRVLVLACLALFLLTYPSSPFSLGNNLPDVAAADDLSERPIRSRHVIFAFAVGLLLLGELSRNRWVVGGAVGLVLLAVWAGGEGLADGFGALGVVVALALALAPERWPGLGTVGIVALVAVGIATPVRRRHTNQELYTEEKRSRFEKGWRALERLPDGSRIALFTGLPSSHGQYLPLYGRRFQHVPVAVDADGRAEPLLHEAPPAPWFAGFDRLREEVDVQAVVCNLVHDARADFVLVVGWPKTVVKQPKLRKPLLELAEAHGAVVVKDKTSLLVDLHALPTDACP
ncbi:MAG: hypothetical protein R3F61_22875 [Myxococcota bacterium]